VLVGLALAGFPLEEADRSAPVLAVFAGFSLVILALSLLWTPLPALVLLGPAVELVVLEVDTHLPAAEAVGYGVGLLVLCELIAWADTLRSHALVAPAVVVRRAAALLVTAGVGAAAATLTAEAGDVDSPNAFVAGVAGAAAVALVVGLVWSIGRRPA